MHRLKIKGTQIAITQTWILESAVGTVKHALDYETFLLSTDTVRTCIYQYFCLTNIVSLFFFLLYIKEPLNKNKLFNPQGHFFLLKPHQSDELLRFPWVSSSNFVASAMLRTDKNICLVKHLFGSGISVHGDGVLYLTQRLLKCWFLLGCSR